MPRIRKTQAREDKDLVVGTARDCADRVERYEGTGLVPQTLTVLARLGLIR